MCAYGREGWEEGGAREEVGGEGEGCGVEDGDGGR